MFEFKKGMICIVDTGMSQKSADADKLELLDAGSPVKIVEIVEPSCPSMVSGQCQAPCKGTCCPRTIIVEDCDGKRWPVKPDFEDFGDEGADFPLIALDDGDAEMLLAKKDWKKFKLAKWTDEGIGSKYNGPLFMMFGIMFLSSARALPGLWYIAFSTIFGLFALYGAALFIAGNKYAQHPLPYGQVLFYHNYEKNKKALETLLKTI